MERTDGFERGVDVVNKNIVQHGCHTTFIQLEIVLVM